MKQQFLCFGNDFSIKDEHGKEAYYVDGKAMSFGNQLSFQDSRRKEIGFISQKFMKLKPTYTISSKGKVLATVSKALMSFRDTFLIDVPGPDDIEVVGKLLEHEYKFIRNKKEVASVSKRYFRATDTYGIEITGSASPMLILGSAVIIDLMCHNAKK